MWVSDNWKDYELVDASDGERLERWGQYTLIRPDPQVIWKDMRCHPDWKTSDAVYRRSKSGGGNWEDNNLPEKWEINYNDIRFVVKPTSFKHTGLFPEQACNWDWFTSKIKKSDRKINILNLFAYTGGATIAAAAAGASVCHVDASKGMVAQARENAKINGLTEAPIRYIVDDCKKFIEREIRRGSKYDAVIMDPPSYGRGPSGELWKLEDNLCELIFLTAELMSDSPLFYLANTYTTGISPSSAAYIIDAALKPRFGGQTVADEIGLPVTQTKGKLPCGASARWTSDKNI